MMIKSLKYEPEAPMKWIAQVENFTIRATFIVYFSLTQLSTTRSVMWKCHMSDSTEGIVQWFKHITFYSLNLIGNQFGYNITDKGLLSFVETFNWIYNKLLGNKIWVYTDHKNLTCKYFNTDIVMWWRLTIEEHIT